MKSLGREMWDDDVLDGDLPAVDMVFLRDPLWYMMRWLRWFVGDVEIDSKSRMKGQDIVSRDGKNNAGRRKRQNWLKGRRNANTVKIRSGVSMVFRLVNKRMVMIKGCVERACQM